MDSDNELTLQFYEYLTQEKEETTTLLQPYFLKLQSREDARENFYGIGTPGDLILLKKLHSIEKLKSGLNSCGSFQQLKSSLLEQTENNEDSSEFSSASSQLQLINGWLEQKESVKRH